MGYYFFLINVFLGGALAFRYNLYWISDYLEVVFSRIFWKQNEHCEGKVAESQKKS